jgi:predicted metal-dependent hydrolase
MITGYQHRHLPLSRCPVNHLGNWIMHNLLHEGLKFFEAGRYFEAHEVWEELWKETPPGPARLFYQGLIQGAVGLHHYGKGNQTGARAQLTKALAKLEAAPPPDATVLDMGAILRQLQSALNSLDSPLSG